MGSQGILGTQGTQGAQGTELLLAGTFEYANNSTYFPASQPTYVAFPPGGGGLISFFPDQQVSSYGRLPAIPPAPVPHTNTVYLTYLDLPSGIDITNAINYAAIAASAKLRIRDQANPNSNFIIFDILAIEGYDTNNQLVAGPPWIGGLSGGQAAFFKIEVDASTITSSGPVPPIWADDGVWHLY